MVPAMSQSGRSPVCLIASPTACKAPAFGKWKKRKSFFAKTGSGDKSDTRQSQFKHHSYYFTTKAKAQLRGRP
ncbi:short-chain dehydrogenase/reductase SDR [Sporosarcina newyorkensis 2681]|uniref:Short-chain dehydrogenase/reductase SDR n=1 Tax=Sporosarcina newyorkensis 2681 TaxID=1027292 RepID=F9DPX2_9BACL|nr:short-chain dehydrogenase/reductase SDR [Sporosarcina newyorkensis 2681]